MIKYKQFLDKKKRNNFAKTEIKKRALKIGLRLNKDLKLRNILLFCLPHSYTKLKNSCIITNRFRSIHRNYGLSRIKLREFTLHGLQTGVTKAAW